MRRWFVVFAWLSLLTFGIFTVERVVQLPIVKGNSK